MIDSGTVDEVIGSGGAEIRAQRSRLETFFHPISVIYLTLSCSSGASFFKDINQILKLLERFQFSIVPVILCPSNGPMCSWTWGHWFFSTEMCELGVLLTQ